MVEIKHILKKCKDFHEDQPISSSYIFFSKQLDFINIKNTV